MMTEAARVFTARGICAVVSLTSSVCPYPPVTIVRISSAVINGLSCRVARTNRLLSARSEGTFSLGLVGVGVSGKETQ
jgi:hypothetical protein